MKRTWKRTFLIAANGIFWVLFLLGCGTTANDPMSAVSSEIMWTKMDSPLFPSTWPPTSDTVWVRYTFAYGFNPSRLMDGNYVTLPLSKTEWKAGTSTTTVLSEEMMQAAVQGVVPLDEHSRLILESGPQVSDYCLALTTLPDLAQDEAKTMLAYYKTWLQYNGAFAELIRADHAAFIDWVRQSQ